MTRRPVEPGSPGAAIVAQEQEILLRVERLIERLAREAATPSRVATDYDSELLSLRDEIAEAKPEDLAPLVEQMARIQSIADGQKRPLKAPVDPGSPYFAHLRLHDRGKSRDVLIGRRGLIDRPSGVQIVDWRDAPVSQIYYRYDEGDDYDEIVAAPGSGGGPLHLEGTVEARRNLSIHHGLLRRIGCPQGVYTSDGRGPWSESEPQALPTLAGGQGLAARPPTASPRTGRELRHGRTLGVESAAVGRVDRHLPEIAALIDRHQFDLITEPSSGLVVIQGGAGSGKTTVALHRVAFLAFHDPRRYRPSRCLIVVPSYALERYVAGVLPALGVRGVQVLTTRSLFKSLRKRVFGPHADRYSDEPPVAVVRVKKHPGLLEVLRRFVDDQLAAAERAILALGSADGAIEAWRSRVGRSPRERLQALRRWATQHHDSRVEILARQLRRRLGDVEGAWAEVLTDSERLRAGLPRLGPRAVSDGEIAETVAWCAAQLDAAAEDEVAEVDEEARAPIDGGALDDSERGRAAGRLDAEDEPILLRLAQLLHGGLFPREGAEAIAYDHLALDEAQDLSAMEVQVLLDLAGDGRPGAPPESRSVTLAGDVAQRLILDNYFDGWEALLGDLGGRGQVAVRPLHLTYRSTQEVMRFARGVLGSLADEGPLAEARPGVPVVLHRFDATGEAVAFLAEALRSLAGREPTASVALLARHPGHADAYYGALQRAEVANLRRVRRQDFPFTPGIDVTDVAQVKGLEFDYVILLEVTGANYPSTVEARHLLHIGATRAAHQLWLTSVGPPSPLVPDEYLLVADEQ